MNEENEDLTVSMPEGFHRRAAADDPRRPGVKLSELRRGPMGRPLEEDGPGMKIFAALALIVLLVIVGVVVFGLESGIAVACLAGGLAVFGVLVFIAWQLWRIANK